MGWAKDHHKRTSPRMQSSDAMQKAVEHTEQQAQRRLDFKMLSDRKKAYGQGMASKADQKGGKRKRRSNRKGKRRNGRKTRRALGIDVSALAAENLEERKRHDDDN